MNGIDGKSEKTFLTSDAPGDYFFGDESSPHQYFSADVWAWEIYHFNETSGPTRR
jgi:hypothetical protein